MSDQALILTGLAFGGGFLVFGFLLAGGHHEVKARIRARRYGGYIR